MLPKSNKRTRQSRDAINERWKRAKYSEAMPTHTFWIEGEDTHFDNNEFVNNMRYSLVA